MAVVENSLKPVWDSFCTFYQDAVSVGFSREFFREQQEVLLEECTAGANQIQRIVDNHLGQYSALLNVSLYILVTGSLVCCILCKAYGILGEIYMTGPIRYARQKYDVIVSRTSKFVFGLPIIRTEVDKKLHSALNQLDDSMLTLDPADLAKITIHKSLPSHGLERSSVESLLDTMASLKHSRWEDGKVSGAVYNGGSDMIAMQTIAYEKFAVSNQLHPDVFPGIRQMEAEIVSMVLNLFNAPASGGGTTTSGGTESLLMTCLAAKMKAYHERGVTQPEILAPTTIHAGFDKAAYYFGIKLRHAPLNPKTFQVDLNAVRRMINSNTILLAGSAPNFPHGIIDDISGLSKLAVKYGIPLHVDACLGSFVVPFLAEANVHDEKTKIPLFDFRLAGVTSISCDTHKYGFAPKGSSVIMYRDKEMRKYQYYFSINWTGGVYASPTLAGSRPGALMAGCWATMMHVGRDGYLQSCREIIGTARKIKEFIRQNIPSLTVIGEPLVSVVAFTSSQFNIYVLADNMSSQKGYHLNALQHPAAIHIACTRLTIEAADKFLADLKSCADELYAKEQEKKKSHQAKKKEGSTTVLYGVAGSVATNGLIEPLVVRFLDDLYNPEVR